MPEARDRLRGNGVEVDASAPEAFAAFIQAAIVEWTKGVKVKAAGIPPE